MEIESHHAGGAGAKKTATQMGIHEVGQQVMKGNLSAAKEKASIYSNYKSHQIVKNMNDEEEDEISSMLANFRSSFDALGYIKQCMDTQHGPYYIYHINNGFHNNTKSYVFFSSEFMAQMAIKMDEDGPESIWQDEIVYFNGMHSRVYGFISFVLWCVHPTMCKVV